MCIEHKNSGICSTTCGSIGARVSMCVCECVSNENRCMYVCAHVLYVVANEMQETQE